VNIKDDYIAFEIAKRQLSIDADIQKYMIKHDLRASQMQLIQMADGKVLVGRRSQPSRWQRIRSWVLAYLKWCWE
jgi:hypothetical protein